MIIGTVHVTLQLSQLVRVLEHEDAQKNHYETDNDRPCRAEVGLGCDRNTDQTYNDKK